VIFGLGPILTKAKCPSPN